MNEKQEAKPRAETTENRVCVCVCVCVCARAHARVCISKHSHKSTVKKYTNTGTSLAGPVVKTLRFHCRGRWVQSLVRELRSRMPLGTAKKKKKKNTIQIHTHTTLPLLSETPGQNSTPRHLSMENPVRFWYQEWF